MKCEITAARSYRKRQLQRPTTTLECCEPPEGGSAASAACQPRVFLARPMQQGRSAEVVSYLGELSSGLLEGTERRGELRATSPGTPGGHPAQATAAGCVRKGKGYYGEAVVRGAAQSYLLWLPAVA